MNLSSLNVGKQIYRCGVVTSCSGDALLLIAILDPWAQFLESTGISATQVFILAGCFLMAGWLLERRGWRQAGTGIWVTAFWKRSSCAALLLVPLLFLDAMVSFQNEDKHDSISYAAYTGDLERVKELAPFDPVLSRTGYEAHYTPLCAAAMMGHRPVVEYLLSRGVDVNRRSDHKETPLSTARDSRIRALLIAAGAHE